jgi:hypothetical protein
MRGDIVLAGFVLTADEWASMDHGARKQLLGASAERPAAAPCDRSAARGAGLGRCDPDDTYEAYETYDSAEP